MKPFLCRLFGHKWRRIDRRDPTYFICIRCAKLDGPVDMPPEHPNCRCSDG